MRRKEKRASKVPPETAQKKNEKNGVRIREAIEVKKKIRFSPKKRKRKRKNMKARVTLVWATPYSPLSTEAQKIEFSKKKIVLFTTGTSGRFFAGFGVRSDDFKKQKKKTKIENMKHGKTTEKKIGKKKRKKVEVEKRKQRKTEKINKMKTSTNDEQ